MAVIASVSGLNVAQTHLAVDFGASQTDVLWMINIYTLTLAALLLPLGALGDRLGRKPMLLAGLVVFGVASIAAAYMMVASIKNLIRAALALTSVLGAVAMMYALLGADFLAVSQLAIYIGAVMVLIMFAIFMTPGQIDVQPQLLHFAALDSEGPLTVVIS